MGKNIKGSVRAIIVRGDNLLVIKRNKYGEQYYTLVGGHIDPGETAEQALVREVLEETSLVVDPHSPQLVIVHDQPAPFGTQYVFTCQAAGDQPQLHAASEEAAETAAGGNTYEPMWLPLAELQRVPFRSQELAAAVATGLKDGFPAAPKRL